MSVVHMKKTTFSLDIQTLTKHWKEYTEHIMEATIYRKTINTFDSNSCKGSSTLVVTSH